MAILDPGLLFNRAEQAYRSGSLDAARRDLMLLKQQVEHPAILHLLGLVERDRGDRIVARATLARAHALAPEDPHIANNFANLLADLGEIDAALAAFDRAIRALPDWPDAPMNRALALRQAGRVDEARDALVALLQRHPALARGWSALAEIGYEFALLDAAAIAYDRALTLKPDHPPALRGRARVSLERGEADALARFAALAGRFPDDQDIAICEAEAREASGMANPGERLEAMLAHDPSWVEGQGIAARMRWEAGNPDFTQMIESALVDHPRNADLWLGLIGALAGVDRFGAAADAAARAQAALGPAPEIALREAIHSGEAGDHTRAERIFAKLPVGLSGRAVHEARHRLRLGEIDRAGKLLDDARRRDDHDIGVWALTAIIWRLTDDDRHHWLHGQPGLIATRSLGLSPDEVEETVAILRRLHRTNVHPIGQSLRGGTQTRGRLLARTELEVRRLGDAIQTAVDAHWRGLPPYDANHPLLRHRDAEPKIAGSWSVRLSDSGFHVAHVHPQGIMSSASYFVLPPPDIAEPKAGWLELGRPPVDLMLDLAPIALVEPVVGSLALFPSTLHHNTRPFTGAERLTVAFDVIP